MDNCDIETIESDLFANNLKLEYVDLSSNKIKYVGENFIKSLTASMTIYFGKNICIDRNSKNIEQFTKLQAVIADRCTPKPKATKVVAGPTCYSADICFRIAKLEEELDALKAEFASQCNF